MRRFWFPLRVYLGILLSSVFLSASAAAQTGPTLSHDLYRKSSFTQEDEQQLSSYAAYWAARLNPATGSPDRLTQIQRATRNLGPAVLNNPNVTAVFRTHYSRAVVPHVRPLIKGQDDAPAIRGLYVAGRLATDPAVMLIIEELETEGGSAVRRNAAAAAGHSALREMTRTSPPLISANTITTLLRVTAEAASREADSAALQRQLELIDQIHRTSMVFRNDLPNFARIAQEARISVFGARAEKLNVEVIEVDAMVMFIRNLRSTFLANPPDQAADGPMLAQHLTRLLRHAHGHLKDESENGAHRQAACESCARLIAEAEGFLKLIDQTVRRPPPSTPNTRLSESWTQRNCAQFESEVKEWDAIMQIAPYRRTN